MHQNISTTLSKFSLYCIMWPRLIKNDLGFSWSWSSIADHDHENSYSFFFFHSILGHTCKVALTCVRIFIDFHLLHFIFNILRQLKHISMPKHHTKSPRISWSHEIECGELSWVHSVKPNQSITCSHPKHGSISPHPVL